MPNGDLDAAGVDHVLEVGEDALGRLGAEVGDARRILEGPDVGLEHQVEGAGLGQRASSLAGRARAERVELVGDRQVDRAG